MFFFCSIGCEGNAIFNIKPNRNHIIPWIRVVLLRQLTYINQFQHVTTPKKGRESSIECK